MKLLKSNSFLDTLSPAEISNLKFQVEETLDFRPPSIKNKKFTSADLWKIHKQKRTFRRRDFISG